MTDQVDVPPVGEQARVEAAAVATTQRSRSWDLLARAGEVRNLGLVGVLAILGIVGAITADTFWTRSNILTILQQGSVIGVLSVGMTFVIIGGGIDLSVGKVMALASVWSTTVATRDSRLPKLLARSLLYRPSIPSYEKSPSLPKMTSRRKW